ncbi:MAG TPA: cyclic nucleotide-binding domain-containing protein [Acidimicrobiales bacterium]|nr:cyclic nucleotide-binding domain-containing protein [Acidimicrobiales bacterium]
MIVRSRPDTSTLAGVAPFDRYGPRALAPLTAHAVRLAVPAGTPLAQEGHRAREVAVVLAGDALVVECGAEVARLGAGAWVGAQESLAGSAHGATIVAGDDLTVLVLPDPAFRWAARSLPGFLDALPPADAGRVATACGGRHQAVTATHAA